MAACLSLSFITMRLVAKKKTESDGAFVLSFEKNCEHAAYLNATRIERIFEKDLILCSNSFLVIVPPYPCMTCFQEEINLVLEYVFDKKENVSVITPEYFHRDLKAMVFGYQNIELVPYNPDESYDFHGYDGIILCTYSNQKIRDVYLTNKFFPFVSKIFLEEHVKKYVSSCKTP